MGGAIESLLLLVRNIDRERFFPCVVTSAEGVFTDELQSSGVNPALIKMEMWRKARGFLLRPITYEKLLRMAESEKISLVHCNTLWDNPYGAMIARSLKIPLVCHIRNTFERAKISKYSLIESDRIICVSDAIKETFRGWENERRVSTVYNGVDLEKFDTAKIDSLEVRRELGIGENDIVIGIVGRLSPEKGQIELIRACGKLKTAGHSFKALIVGEPSRKEAGYTDDLRNSAEELGVADSVIFTGFRRDIERITASFDIAVFPSLETANEGFGRGIIEAMALGKPVIGSATGGVPEVIDGGKTGLLTSPGDIESLADKIESLIRNEPLRRELGENGNRRARTHFSVSSYVTGIEKIYSELL